MTYPLGTEPRSGDTRPTAHSHYPKGRARSAEGAERYIRPVGRLSLMAILVSSLTALASPTSAAEPAHCYEPGKEPAGAMKSTDAQRRDVTGLRFGYQFIPVIYRRFCGEVHSEDSREYMRGIVFGLGCSLGSHFGQVQMEVLERPFDNIEGAAMFNCVRDRFPDDTRKFCDTIKVIDRLDTLALPSDEYRLFAAASEQMEKHLFSVLECAQ